MAIARLQHDVNIYLYTWQAHAQLWMSLTAPVTSTNQTCGDQKHEHA